jgi:DNA modification methylase
MNKFDAQIVRVAIDSVIPYANNTKKHPLEQIDKLASMIAEYGHDVPIVVDANNVVIKGHGRLLACKKLGMETVPVIIRADLTPAQAKAARIADNKVAESEWDMDLLRLELTELDELGFDLDLTGFEDFDLSEFDDTDVTTLDDDADLDNVPEAPVVPITKLGDVWLCGKHRLMCGDSTSIDAVDALMNGDKAEMVFTDPPYNVKISGLGSAASENSIGRIHGEFKMASGEMSKDEFTDFLRAVFTCLIAASKDGSIHYICMDWRHIQELTSAGEIYTELKNLCVWNKNNGGMGTFYRNKHELIFAYKNGTEKHTNNFQLGETGRYRTNVWDYPMVTSFSNGERGNEKLHPTVKPTQLVVDAILDCSNDGEMILDLFGGSGTTMIACEKTNRVARLMELEEKYCDVIVRRWQELTGKAAVLESSGELFNALVDG